jgi:hypothetical protein
VFKRCEGETITTVEGGIETRRKITILEASEGKAATH